EAHDAEVVRSGEDAYREPLAEMRLVLFRQPDPKGEKRPSDDLEVVAQTSGRPQRLDNKQSSGTYEYALDYEVKEAGRYMVRVEGKPPESTRPRGSPTLPGMKQAGELRPRLFVSTLAGGGRAVLHDFATCEGAVGMPADARFIVAVGAADAQKNAL